LQDE
jgi:hypothetical protein